VYSMVQRREKERRKTRDIWARHQPLQQSPCIRSVTYLRHKYTCNRRCYKKHQKVLAKQKQRNESTTTIAIEKRMAAIDSRRRIDPGASVPAAARSQEEGAHRNPRSRVGSRKGLAENATDATRRPTSKRRRGLRGLRGLPHRSDDRIQSEREE